MLFKKRRRIIAGTENDLEEGFNHSFPGGDMIRSRSNNRASQQPVFTVSHSRQERLCNEVYDYLTRIKIQKLKKAIRQLNTIVNRILR